jgi:hypothetical protein
MSVLVEPARPALLDAVVQDAAGERHRLGDLLGPLALVVFLRHFG